MSFFTGFAQSSVDVCESNQLKSLLKESKKYTLSRDYVVSITKLLQLIEEAEIDCCHAYLSEAYHLLSLNYKEIRDTLPALNYAKKALLFAKKTDSNGLLSAAYTNLATFYVYDKSNQQKALDYLTKSLSLSRKQKDSSFLSSALHIAELYKVMGNYEEMPAYLSMAEASLANNDDKYDDLHVYLAILWGDYYMHLNNKKLSRNYYDHAYKIIIKDSLRLRAIGFFDRYAAILQAEKEYEEAYVVQKNLLLFERQAAHAETEENLLITMAHAETQEYKRQRNKAKLEQIHTDHDLQRKNTISLLLGALLVLLLIFIIYLIISTRFRKMLIRKLQRNNIDLKNAKIMAEKSNEAKALFFSTVSHEMRTPLYGVSGVVSLLSNKEELKPYKEELSSLQFSAGHLLDIINDLLDFSKLDNNNFKLHERPLNLKMLVKEIVSSVDHYHSKQKSKIHLDFDESLPNYILADSRRLSQVMLNILSNAIKFTKDGDIWIRLRSKKIGDARYRIHFSIEDNGIGMDAESQKTIFDDFVQLENFSTEERNGTGLGLPIVKKILEKMNSTISLESKKGVGTTFNFSIEFDEATLLEVIELSSEKKSIAKNGASHQVNGSSILIVDDNKINRMVTRKLLLDKNAKVTEASNGEEALRLIDKMEYDLVLMDINMPGLNGFETARNIREREHIMPIVALTAADASYIDAQIKASGMDAAITKPYTMDEFIKTLSLHLSLRKQPEKI